MPRLPERAAYIVTFGSMTAAAIVVIALIVIDSGDGDGGGETRFIGSPTPTATAPPNGVRFLDGKVAVSLSQPAADGLSVSPGDWVDVYAKFDGKAETIVENVQVLSISRTPPNLGNPDTVTLALTPEYAQVIAQEKANSLSLSRSASSSIP